MKIALLGLDSFFFASALIDALRAAPGCELAACCDLGVPPQDVRDNAGLYPDELARRAGAPLYHSPADLFAAHDIEGVCVATRPSRLPDVLPALAGRGLHAYLVKPAAASERDLEGLAAFLSGSAGVVVSGLTARLDPVLRDARERVAAGAVGKPAAVRVMHQHGRLTSWPRTSWYFEAAEAPPAINLGWYCADLLGWFTGSRLEDLSGRAGRLVDRDSPHPDYIKAVGRLKSGALASLDILFGVAWPYPAFEIEVIGETGAIRVSQPCAAGQWFTARGALGFGQPPADLLQAELRQWVRACGGGEEPFITGEEIVANLRDCFLLERSLAAGPNGFASGA